MRGPAPVKTLTITQPWATLIAIGAKKIETRSWRANYRGQLAIHAAKTFPKDALSVCYDPRYAAALSGQSIQTGVVLATCRLADCRPTDELVARGLTEQEEAFGDFSAGCFGWLLEEVTLLANPVPAAGALGLWDWEGAL